MTDRPATRAPALDPVERERRNKQHGPTAAPAELVEETQMTSQHPKAALAALPLVLALIVSACGGGSSPSPTGAGGGSTPAVGSPAAAGAVTIANFAFGPATLEVAAGTTVTWTNSDTTAHTVTADDGSFDSKSIASGSTFSQAFAKAGTYTYHCAIHPSMKATITVH